MSIHRLLTAALVVGLFAPAAFAQTPRTSEPSLRPLGINARQARQAVRIQRGIESGTITETEARRLTRIQSRIRSMERRFRQSNDTLGRGEVVRLQRRLAFSSRAIRRAVRHGRTGR